MRHIVFALILAVLLPGAAAEMRAGLPTPCIGDKIVHVAELPNQATPDGQRFNLGYRFSGCFSGEWVGYIGDSDRYLSFSPGHMQMYQQ